MYSSYKYLGYVFSKWGTSHYDVHNKAIKGWAVTKSLRSVLWDRNIIVITEKMEYNLIF
jgi:hypothetical protein